MIPMVTLMTTLLLGVVATQREHKVHNLILYPEKHSWCTTTPIQQVVASPGYEPVTIENNICVGACYSYSIPSTQPAEPGELIGPYCDSCQPAETECYHVTLKADAKNLDGAATFQKRVQIIKNCSCNSCDKYHQEHCEISFTNELPIHLFSISKQVPKIAEEIPELLHFAPEKNVTHAQNRSHHVATSQRKFELDSNLISLLKSIQNGADDDVTADASYDVSDSRDQMRNLIRIIGGAERELSDKNLMEFVNFVNINNSEDLEVDLARLKEVLTHFQQQEQQIYENFEKIEQDLKKQSSNHHGNHHHVIGEDVHVGLKLEHLVKGPHGSMVLSPDLKVEEKLNIDSDILKPNHDGVVIAYENPSRRGAGGTSDDVIHPPN